MSDPVTRLNAALEGRYAIERELGEGGMATVYLAEDLKHHRKVALKVLKPELAALVGAERFLAEITVTANLQHPHILPLHDSGEADGFLFYVMPYVEGETLRERIDREKQLPVDEAVRIATAVGNALQSAHEKGIVHRDIKPANILLSRGEPLIADFGIALALSAAGGGERLTETGLSLGTPYYMSPEQATGDQVVGPSSDTYALGCVMYEMLVGEPPYPGTTAQAVLGRIIAGEPVSAAKHRPSVPANVDAAVRKALEKLPADRFRTAQEFVRALGDEHFRHGEAAPGIGGAPVGPWNRVSATLAGSTLLFAIAFGLSLLRSNSPATSVLRSVIVLPEGDRIALADLAPSGTGRPSLDLSRDGTQLAYVVARGGVSQLVLHRLDEWEGRLLPGTEGAFHPFFSHDGQWIGFFTRTELKKISVRGGTAQTLVSPVTYPIGASWGENDTIIFAQDDGKSLYRVSSEGGDAVAVSPDVGKESLWWPQVLPDGQSVLATDGAGPLPSVVVVSLTDGEREVLVERGSGAVYTQSGHLVYAGESGVMAVPFDLSRLTATGTAMPVLEGVRREAPGGAPQFAVSANGLLAYIPGPDMQVSTPVWVDRNGVIDSIPIRPDRYGTFDLSPDGRQLAITIYGTTTDVWLSDFAPGSEPRPLTTLGGSNGYPAWKEDGSGVAFASDIRNPERTVQTAIFWQSIDGGQAEPLMERNFPGGVSPEAWSRDGVLAFDAYSPDNGFDIWVLPSDSLEPRLFIGSPVNEFAGAFSPDGRWLAYTVYEAGQMEVYVTDYPAGDERILLSSNAGEGKEPKWSPNGDEVFFRSDRHVFSVSVEIGSELRPGTPRSLFECPCVTVLGPEFDVGPEAERFLMLREPPQPPATQIRLITNWFEELNRLAPPDEN